VVLCFCKFQRRVAEVPLKRSSSSSSSSSACTAGTGYIHPVVAAAARPSDQRDPSAAGPRQAPSIQQHNLLPSVAPQDSEPIRITFYLILRASESSLLVTTWQPFNCISFEQQTPSRFDLFLLFKVGATVNLSQILFLRRAVFLGAVTPKQKAVQSSH
jgi:hypothetical protein